MASPTCQGGDYEILAIRVACANSSRRLISAAALRFPLQILRVSLKNRPEIRHRPFRKRQRESRKALIHRKIDRPITARRQLKSSNAVEHARNAARPRHPIAANDLGHFWRKRPLRAWHVDAQFLSLANLSLDASNRGIPSRKVLCVRQNLPDALSRRADVNDNTTLQRKSTLRFRNFRRTSHSSILKGRLLHSPPASFYRLLYFKSSATFAIPAFAQASSDSNVDPALATAPIVSSPSLIGTPPLNASISVRSRCPAVGESGPVFF